MATATSSTRPARSARGGSDTAGRAHRSDALLVASLASFLLLWFLWPFTVKGSPFPIGPDGPVYLWWTRLASVDGLSAVGSRPGVPALSLVAEGTLGLSVVQVTAALEVVLGVAVGLASAALVRARTGVLGWMLAGLLAGTFATHLAAGYLANLATAAAFVSAVALLDRSGTRPAVIAAVALAGGGLAHPLFFLLAATILVAAAAIAWRTERREALRLAGVAFGAGAVVGSGLLAAMVGAAPPEVDTSRDAFLRRAGLTPELRNAYLDRFVHRWTRYVEWISIPLAIAGSRSSGRGVAERVLRAWFAVTIAGVLIALATRWLPPDRFVTFGFAIPVLSALGLVRLRRLLRSRRVVAEVATGMLAVLMLAGAGIAWNRQEPFLSEDEVRAGTIANDAIARLDPGTPLAFLVNESDETVTFLATRAGNVIRAAVPPTRIRDVVVVVPPPPEGATSVERRVLERTTAHDLAEAEARIGTSPTVFVLRPFDAADRPVGAILVDPEVVRKDLFPIEPLEPSSRAGIAWASVATLALLLFAGYGWARIGLVDAITAAAAAPAIGAAVLILAGVALDALGVPLGERPGALAASALAAIGGYLLRYVLERRARAHPSPEIEQ